MKAGEEILLAYGFKTNHLTLAYRRFSLRKTPADYLIQAYLDKMPMNEITNILSKHYEYEDDWFKFLC